MLTILQEYIGLDYFRMNMKRIMPDKNAKLMGNFSLAYLCIHQAQWL